MGEKQLQSPVESSYRINDDLLTTNLVVALSWKLKQSLTLQFLAFTKSFQPRLHFAVLRSNISKRVLNRGLKWLFAISDNIFASICPPPASALTNISRHNMGFALTPTGFTARYIYTAA